MIQNNLISIRLLTEQVESQGLDIAYKYDKFTEVGYAIANDCGEEGREYFHRLCKLCPKYDEKETDNLFSGGLKNGRKKNGLGSVFKLASDAGVEVEKVYERIKAESKDSEDSKDSGLYSGDAANLSVEPEIELSHFSEYDFPFPLKKLGLGTKNSQERDIRLLGALAVIGAIFGYRTYTRYDKNLNPNLLIFVVGNSASGKGSLSPIKEFAKPFHQELIEKSEKAKKAYKQEMAEYERKKSNGEIVGPQPEKPGYEMFIIPGDNTSAGLMKNLKNSGGRGVIIQSEADTLNVANSNQYGHFSHTLRDLFDNNDLESNRSTEDTYLSIEETCVSIVLSGTPEQAKTLIKSSENGLFSRFQYYYMKRHLEWSNRFPKDDIDPKSYFKELAKEFKGKFDKKMGKFDEKKENEHLYILKLTESQEAKFNDAFSLLFKRAQMIKADMFAFVTRLAHAVLRMMNTVALLRYMETEELSLVNWREREQPEKSHWELYINDDDFGAVLSMAPVLYEHGVHVISFMKSVTVTRSPNIERDRFLQQLPKEFKTKEAEDLAYKLGINTSSAKTWLNREANRKNGFIQRVTRGAYRKLV